MIERGFTVDMTDASRGMVRKARERTGQDVRLLRFEELDAVDAYGAVWAHASLHHQPMSGLGEVLIRIHRAIRVNGWFFANYMPGCGEGRDRFGRLYNCAPSGHLLELYRSTGWQVDQAEKYGSDSIGGVKRDWIAMTAFKLD